jgi:hypothetical protein
VRALQGARRIAGCGKGKMRLPAFRFLSFVLSFVEQIEPEAGPTAAFRPDAILLHGTFLPVTLP